MPATPSSLGLSAFPASDRHCPRPTGSGANFLGDLLSFVRIKIHRNFNPLPFDVNAYHTHTRRADLQIRLDFAVVVDAHAVHRFLPERGVTCRRRIDKRAPSRTAHTMTEITIRNLGTGDAGWLIQRHAELYEADEGFDQSFEPFLAELMASILRNWAPPIDRAWIAVRDGHRLGSIFCVATDDPGVAKLRLFLVEPDARGTGLGQRLLDLCLAHAKATGHNTLRLWTHESHKAACALYARNDFHCTDSKPVRSFGVDLVEQTWERDLRKPLQS